MFDENHDTRMARVKKLPREKTWGQSPNNLNRLSRDFRFFCRRANRCDLRHAPMNISLPFTVDTCCFGLIFFTAFPRRGGISKELLQVRGTLYPLENQPSKSRINGTLARRSPSREGGRLVFAMKFKGGKSTLFKEAIPAVRKFPP